MGECRLHTGVCEMPSEDESLTARLAASLPRQLSPDHAMLMVRQAVERARAEQLPLTPPVIAELIAASVTK